MGICQGSLPKTTSPLKYELKAKLKDSIIIFMIGGPGSGKGVQAVRLSNKYNFYHLAIGDLLREEATRSTNKGKAIRDIMLKGALVPSKGLKPFAGRDLWKRWVPEASAPSGKWPLPIGADHLFLLKEATVGAVKKGYIIDLLTENMLKAENFKGFFIEGFPREINQARLFEEVVGRLPNIVIVFDCSTETMIQRLMIRSQMGKRVDDHERIIRQRLETHYTLCEPVLTYYLQKGVLRNILGEELQEVVYAKCCSVVDDVIKAATSTV